MNLGFYWRRGLPGSMADVVLLWRNAYRPMGAAFYLPIYDTFGMNPLPYRVAVMAILAANIFLSWRIARLVTKSMAAATLTAVLVTAHASMLSIYYNTSMIYDVLAFFFTALMLWIYVRGRERGTLTWMESLAVILIYLAAINSKEIAVVGAAATGNSRRAAVRSLEASLRRLRTDHVDLFWVHLPDGVTPVAEMGWLSIFIEPTGAALGLWQAKKA